MLSNYFLLFVPLLALQSDMHLLLPVELVQQSLSLSQRMSSQSDFGEMGEKSSGL
jgi:hypothetical protein